MRRYSHRGRHRAAPCVRPGSRRRRGKGIDLVAMVLAGLGQALALVNHAWAPGLGDWLRQALSTLYRLVPRITSPMGLPARAAYRAAWRASRSRRGHRRGPRTATWCAACTGAYLTRRSDERDRITIRTAGSTEIVATGEAACALDAAALVRAVGRGHRARAVILFVAANPSGTSQLALDQECTAVERELQMAAHRDDFEFRSKWVVSVDELARHLMELQPTVIHFSGHGLHSQLAYRHGGSTTTHRDIAVPGDVSGGIVLHDERHDSQFVTARALAMMIESAARSARLVVLNACYSDIQADALRTVVDCVVGMTGAIEDVAAREFAVGFYRALGNRTSVGRAVEHAVATLAAKQLPDEHLPRCQTRDGIDAHQITLGPPG